MGLSDSKEGLVVRSALHLWVVDRHTLEVKRQIPFTGTAVTSPGSSFAYSLGFQQLTVIDLQAGRVVHHFPPPSAEPSQSSVRSSRLRSRSWGPRVSPGRSIFVCHL